MEQSNQPPIPAKISDSKGSAQRGGQEVRVKCLPHFLEENHISVHEKSEAQDIGHLVGTTPAIDRKQGEGILQDPVKGDGRLVGLGNCTKVIGEACGA